MPLLSIQELSVSFRGPNLLDSVSCQIEPAQRIGLLGRNGSGKTTFMRILAGEMQPDSGSVTLASGARIAMLGQEVPRELQQNVESIVCAGWQPPPNSAQLDESDHDWQREHAVEKILTRMQLNAALEFDSLSSGMKRRVLLARALVSQPDVLLLDEPTNHLDITAINWLEEFLLRWSGTLIFVTHDRTFLRNLATRILEIDRGRLFDWSCDYDTFLERKEAALSAEEKQNALFDKRLAEEEVWIRQGIKARRTRNEGRVRALESMRRERGDRREKQGTANLQIQEAQRSGNLVVDADSVSFAYENQPIIQDFSTTILRGDKVGIVGSNGCGKSTLLKILLGRLKPDTGTVRLGTRLQIAYFDQLREQLDPEATVQEDVGEGYDQIKIGEQSRHILGYLQDFLFSPERARMQIKFLSGGERNRVLLAKLFAKPANVIVLDEPTNDLDAETLEMLEARLVAFSGTALVVSHDRSFLNNVVSSTIAFHEGQVREYAGGYDDFVRQTTQRKPVASSSTVAGSNVAGSKVGSNVAVKSGKAQGKSVPEKSAPVAASISMTSSGKNSASESASKPRKLSYKEQLELKSLPALIESLESEIAAIHLRMAAPDYFQQSGEQLASDHARLQHCQQELESKFSRWELLEASIQ
jgi:ATP-binding cassette subfamily F protein uup